MFKRLTLAAATAFVLTAAVLVAQGDASNGAAPSVEQPSAPPAFSIDWGALALAPR